MYLVVEICTSQLIYLGSYIYFLVRFILWGIYIYIYVIFMRYIFVFIWFVMGCSNILSRYRLDNVQVFRNPLPQQCDILFEQALMEIKIYTHPKLIYFTDLCLPGDLKWELQYIHPQTYIPCKFIFTFLCGVFHEVYIL